jgi:hypothetical protein
LRAGHFPMKHQSLAETSVRRARRRGKIMGRRIVAASVT